MTNDDILEKLLEDVGPELHAGLVSQLALLTEEHKTIILQEWAQFAIQWGLVLACGERSITVTVDDTGVRYWLNG